MLDFENEPSPEYEKYLLYYSRLLEVIIDLHNKHLVFKKYRGKDSAKDLRKSLREFRDINNQLGKSVLLTFKESLLNSKLKQKRSKEYKLKHKRKNNKNVTDNRTTQNNI